MGAAFRGEHHSPQTCPVSWVSSSTYSSQQPGYDQPLSQLTFPGLAWCRHSLIFGPWAPRRAFSPEPQQEMSRALLSRAPRNEGPGWLVPGGVKDKKKKVWRPFASHHENDSRGPQAGGVLLKQFALVS